jgi:hypothetical protein
MRQRMFVAASVAAVALSLVAACSGSRSSPRSSASGDNNTFVLSEFTIIPPANTLRSGRVTITADNVGGEVHELVIVRADSASALPMQPDGSVDEDKIAPADKVGEIADIAGGSHTRKSFRFAPGTYVAFCNIVDAMMNDSDMGSHMGHVHFAQGMHITFTVS